MLNCLPRGGGLGGLPTRSRGLQKSASVLGSFRGEDSFLGGSVVKNLPAKQETQVQSTGQEDALGKGMATHSIPLPGKSQGRRSPVDHSPWGPNDTAE